MDTRIVDRVLLTIPEVSRAVGVSQRFVWSLIAAGRLPAVRLGRRAVRIDRTDLDKLIQGAKGGER